MSERMLRGYPPERSTPADENASRALSGKICLSDGVNVGSANGIICEVQDVRISLRGHREGAVTADADGDAGPF